MAIAVFYGGRSCEHDVSVVTGVQTLANFKTEGYVPVYIDRNGRWLVPDEWRILSAYRGEIKGKRCFVKPRDRMLYIGRGRKYKRIDAAIICCHGAGGEDGELQGVLQSAGIPYTGGGIAASAVGLDKRLSRRAFAAAGLSVVEGITAERSEYENSLRALIERAAALTYPLIVKPASTGSSIGVSRANDGKELIKALNLAFEWDDAVVIERALSDFIELNCAVLGGAGRVPEPSEVEMPARLSEILSYADKYERGGLSGKGGRSFPADIPSELRAQVRSCAAAAFNAVNASGVARVDFLYDKASGTLFVNEINTVPGSLALYLIGDARQTLATLVDIAKAEYDRREARSYRYESRIIHGKQ